MEPTQQSTGDLTISEVRQLPRECPLVLSMQDDTGHRVVLGLRQPSIQRDILIVEIHYIAADNPPEDVILSEKFDFPEGGKGARRFWLEDTHGRRFWVRESGEREMATAIRILRSKGVLEG